jgi:hypothetical protein
LRLRSSCAGERLRRGPVDLEMCMESADMANLSTCRLVVSRLRSDRSMKPIAIAILVVMTVVGGCAQDAGSGNRGGGGKSDQAQELAELEIGSKITINGDKGADLVFRVPVPGPGWLVVRARDDGQAHVAELDVRSAALLPDDPFDIAAPWTFSSSGEDKVSMPVDAAGSRFIMIKFFGAVEDGTLEAEFFPAFEYEGEVSDPNDTVEEAPQLEELKDKRPVIIHGSIDSSEDQDVYKIRHHPCEHIVAALYDADKQLAFAGVGETGGALFESDYQRGDKAHIIWDANVFGGTFWLNVAGAAGTGDYTLVVMNDFVGCDSGD